MLGREAGVSSGCGEDMVELDAWSRGLCAPQSPAPRSQPPHPHRPHPLKLINGGVLASLSRHSTSHPFPTAVSRHWAKRLGIQPAPIPFVASPLCPSPRALGRVFTTRFAV